MPAWASETGKAREAGIARHGREGSQAKYAGQGKVGRVKQAGRQGR
jgi:hypothetical protein